MIASGTFGEAMRRKILNVFLFVALALIVMGFAFASFQPRQEIVLIKSMGLGTIVLAGVFISVILGINLIPNEIERRTIYTILSKPVQRYQFLCGKFLGGLMTVLSNIALMGIALIVLTFIKEHSFDHDVVDVSKGVLMTFFQLTLVGAVALFFSVFLSPFVNFFLTFAVYLLGSTGLLESLAAPDEKKSQLTIAVLQVPALHRAELRQLQHPEPDHPSRRRDPERDAVHPAEHPVRHRVYGDPAHPGRADLRPAGGVGHDPEATAAGDAARHRPAALHPRGLFAEHD